MMSRHRGIWAFATCVLLGVSMAACGSGSTTGDGSEPSFEKTVFFSTAPNDKLRDLSSVSPQPEGKETFSADDSKLYLGSYSLRFDGKLK